MTLQIRKATYRGQEGFGIYGHKPGQENGWPVRVFVAGTDRAKAERVKARLLAGAEHIFDDEDGQS